MSTPSPYLHQKVRRPIPPPFHHLIPPPTTSPPPSPSSSPPSSSALPLPSSATAHTTYHHHHTLPSALLLADGTVTSYTPSSQAKRRPSLYTITYPPRPSSSSSSSSPPPPFYTESITLPELLPSLQNVTKRPSLLYANPTLVQTESQKVEYYRETMEGRGGMGMEVEIGHGLVWRCVLVAAVEMEWEKRVRDGLEGSGGEVRKGNGGFPRYYRVHPTSYLGSSYKRTDGGGGGKGKKKREEEEGEKYEGGVVFAPNVIGGRVRLGIQIAYDYYGKLSAVGSGGGGGRGRRGRGRPSSRRRGREEEEKEKVEVPRVTKPGGAVALFLLRSLGVLDDDSNDGGENGGFKEGPDDHHDTEDEEEEEEEEEDDSDDDDYREGDSETTISHPKPNDATGPAGEILTNPSSSPNIDNNNNNDNEEEEEEQEELINPYFKPTTNSIFNRLIQTKHQASVTSPAEIQTGICYAMEDSIPCTDIGLDLWDPLRSLLEDADDATKTTETKKENDGRSITLVCTSGDSLRDLPEFEPTSFSRCRFRLSSFLPSSPSLPASSPSSTPRRYRVGEAQELVREEEEERERERREEEELRERERREERKWKARKQYEVWRFGCVAGGWTVWPDWKEFVRGTLEREDEGRTEGGGEGVASSESGGDSGFKAPTATEPTPPPETTTTTTTTTQESNDAAIAQSLTTQRRSRRATTDYTATTTSTSVIFYGSNQSLTVPQLVEAVHRLLLQSYPYPMTLIDLKRLIMQDGNGSSSLRAAAAAGKGEGLGGGVGGEGMGGRGDWKKVRSVLGRLLFRLGKVERVLVDCVGSDGVCWRGLEGGGCLVSYGGEEGEEEVVVGGEIKEEGGVEEVEGDGVLSAPKLDEQPQQQQKEEEEEKDESTTAMDVVKNIKGDPLDDDGDVKMESDVVATTKKEEEDKNHNAEIKAEEGQGSSAPNSEEQPHQQQEEETEKDQSTTTKEVPKNTQDSSQNNNNNNDVKMEETDPNPPPSSPTPSTTPSHSTHHQSPTSWPGWQQHTFGLEIQRPWAALLLDGSKTIETRRYDLPPGLRGRKIEILETEAGEDGVSVLGDDVLGDDVGMGCVKVVGWVVVDRVVSYRSRSEFELDEGKHLVSPDSNYGWDSDTEVIYGWVVSQYGKYDASTEGGIFPYSSIIRRLRSLYELQPHPTTNDNHPKTTKDDSSTIHQNHQHRRRRRKEQTERRILEKYVSNLHTIELTLRSLLLQHYGGSGNGGGTFTNNNNLVLQRITPNLLATAADELEKDHDAMDRFDFHPPPPPSPSDNEDGDNEDSPPAAPQRASDVEVIWRTTPPHPLLGTLIYRPNTADGDDYYSRDVSTLRCDWFRIVSYCPSVPLTPVSNGEDGMEDVNSDNVVDNAKKNTGNSTNNTSNNGDNPLVQRRIRFRAVRASLSSLNEDNNDDDAEEMDDTTMEAPDAIILTEGQVRSGMYAGKLCRQVHGLPFSSTSRLRSSSSTVSRGRKKRRFGYSDDEDDDELVVGVRLLLFEIDESTGKEKEEEVKEEEKSGEGMQYAWVVGRDESIVETDADDNNDTDGEEEDGAAKTGVRKKKKIERKILLLLDVMDRNDDGNDGDEGEQEEIQSSNAFWATISPTDPTIITTPTKTYRTEKQQYHPSSPAYQACQTVLETLKNHVKAGPFLDPVDPVELDIPDYFEIVKEPMDVTTMEDKLARGCYGRIPSPSLSREQREGDEYQSPTAKMLHGPFLYDLNIIFTNAMLFNPPSDWVHQAAAQLKKICGKKVEMLTVRAEKEFEWRVVQQQQEKEEVVGEGEDDDDGDGDSEEEGRKANGGRSSGRKGRPKKKKPKKMKSMYVDEDSDIDMYLYESDYLDDDDSDTGGRRGRKRKRKKPSSSSSHNMNSSSRLEDFATRAVEYPTVIPGIMDDLGGGVGIDGILSTLPIVTDAKTFWLPPEWSCRQRRRGRRQQQPVGQEVGTTQEPVGEVERMRCILLRQKDEFLRCRSGLHTSSGVGGEHAGPVRRSARSHNVTSHDTIGHGASGRGGKSSSSVGDGGGGEFQDDAELERVVEYYLEDYQPTSFSNDDEDNVDVEGRPKPSTVVAHNRSQVEEVRESLHEDYFARLYRIHHSTPPTTSSHNDKNTLSTASASQPTTAYGTYTDGSFPPYLGRIVPRGWSPTTKGINEDVNEHNDEDDVTWEIRAPYILPALHWVLRGLVASGHLERLESSYSLLDGTDHHHNHNYHNMMVNNSGVVITNHAYYCNNHSNEDNGNKIKGWKNIISTPRPIPYDILDVKQIARRKKKVERDAEEKRLLEEQEEEEAKVEMSAYEKMRAERVARNKERLKLLGLG